MSVILTADKDQSLTHDAETMLVMLRCGHLSGACPSIRQISPTLLDEAGKATSPWSLPGAASPTGSASVQEISAIVSTLDGARMTAKIIRLAVASPAPSPNRDSLFFESAHFVSMCPTCKDSRLQLGYSSGGLLRRLNGDRLIEAYCVTCNQFWPITAEERARLARQFEHLRLS